MSSIREKWHRMSSPPFFYRGARSWSIAFYIIGGVLLVVGSVWGLFFVPVDRLQGDVFRIIFIHVPSAHVSQLIYVSMAIAGFTYVVWRLKLADIYLQSAAGAGAVLTALALFSGIIWGIPTWGTGWVWDARTTSMLVQLFLFLGLIALRQAIPNAHRAAMAVSILAIVGVINIPIIKYSVEWFTTLHQPASIKITGESTIAPIFLWPLFVNLFGVSVLYAGIILTQMRVYVLTRDAGTSWVDEEVSKTRG